GLILFEISRNPEQEPKKIIARAQLNCPLQLAAGTRVIACPLQHQATGRVSLGIARRKLDCAVGRGKIVGAQRVLRDRARIANLRRLPDPGKESRTSDQADDQAFHYEW